MTTMTTPPITVDQSIEKAQAEILDLIAEGRVPATVASFAELHDYVDANCLGGLCDVVYEQLRGDGDDMPAVLTDFVDAVQSALHLWLADRGHRTTAIRLLKAYNIGDVDAKAGDIVEAVREPWDPTDPENAYIKKRAIGRDVWLVRWTDRFSTTFVDGLDAVAVDTAPRAH